MRKLYLIAAIASAGAAFADGVDGGLVQVESRSRWHFTIGPVMAPRVRTRIRSPYRVLPTPAALSSSTSGTYPAALAGAGASTGYADRTYADGYVKLDEGTSDPDSMISGLTWNWGADDVAAQYSGGTMVFRTDATRWTRDVTAAAYGDGRSFRRECDRDVLLGVDVMGGWTFFEDETFDVAVDTGFRFYGVGEQTVGSGNGVTATTTFSEYRIADSYDASGWTTVPTGSHSGTPGGPGPVIGATPGRTEELMGTTVTSDSYFCNTRTKLNYRIWDLRIGPTVGWKATDWLTIRGGVYNLLGLVDAKLRTQVATETGLSKSQKTTCTGVFGVASSLSAQINLTKNVFLVGGAEYDWWTNAVRMRTGGAGARIKLSDFTVTLALGVEF